MTHRPRCGFWGAGPSGECSCFDDEPDEPHCCGERHPGVEGEPLVLACQLCPDSPTYWRNNTTG